MAHRTFYVTLPVRDLSRSVAFFTELGFEVDQTRTGEQGACIVIRPGVCVMLAARPFFETLTVRKICDTSTHVEALLSVECERREDVEKTVKKALALGGTTQDEPKDHGFMVDWGFYDLDGHGWGVLWANPEAAPPK